MESSGNGPSASGHRHHADGAIDFSKAAGRIRDGHDGPDCPECREFRIELRRRVETARRSLLLPPDIAPRDRCVAVAYERIRDALHNGLEDSAVDVAYVSRLVNRVVSDHYVEHLRARRGEAWHACELRLLQLACAQFGHRFHTPSAEDAMDDGSRGVLCAVQDPNERQLIRQAKDVVLAALVRHFKAGKPVENIGGLMYSAIKRAAASIKGQLKRKDEVAGAQNPARALTFSAITARRRQDGEEGPAFEITAQDDPLEQVADESAAEVKARLAPIVAEFLVAVDRETKKAQRKKKLAPLQLARVILDALAETDTRYAAIAERYDVNRHYVDVQVNRFRDLLKDVAWRDRLIRLFGADPADWPLPSADVRALPPGADVADAGDSMDDADVLDIEDMDAIEEAMEGANAFPQPPIASLDGRGPAAVDESGNDHHDRGNYDRRSVHENSAVPLQGAEGADG